MVHAGASKISESKDPPMRVARKANKMQTERLLLRPLEMSDSSAFLGIFSDARTMQYWSKQPISSMAEAESLIKQDIEWSELDNCICLGVALSDSNLVVGKITLFQLDKQNRRAEIGYVMDRRQWGKGYMTEAMEWLLDYAFEVLKLHRLEADTDPDNIPSLALLERFGFTREGLFRDRWRVHGKWHDSVMLGLLEEDYRKNSATDL
jgi:RimJ/RimL family protein N-acetyltransferase